MLKRNGAEQRIPAIELQPDELDDCESLVIGALCQRKKWGRPLRDMRKRRAAERVLRVLESTPREGAAEGAVVRIEDQEAAVLKEAIDSAAERKAMDPEALAERKIAEELLSNMVDDPSFAA